MKIIKHTRKIMPEHFNRSTRPMSVWLHRNVELRIYPGDTIKEVGAAIREHWPKLDTPTVRQIAAFWFALGERVSSGEYGPWSARELRIAPRRAYSPRTPTKVSPKARAR